MTMQKRLAIGAGLGALAIALGTMTNVLGSHWVRVVGIILFGVSGVLLLARASTAEGRRIVPSLLWGLATFAGMGALGWDMRLTIPMAALAVAGAVTGKRYNVAL